MVDPVLDLHTQYELSRKEILVPTGVIVFLSGAIRKESFLLSGDRRISLFF
jgi:hypothetical protein